MRKEIDGVGVIELGSIYSTTNQVRVYPTLTLGMRAQMATELIQRWGSVAGIPDGEDSAGRAKVRLQTPEELVNRACEVAGVAFNEFQDRGWLLEVPSLEECPE